MRNRAVGVDRWLLGAVVLLSAFGRLPDTTRLWVAGDGPQTEALRDVGIEYLTVSWPADGRGRVGEFVERVMPDF